MRLKVYNKFVHLLTSGQFKKKINMTLQKLLYPTAAFFQDKMLPTMETGLGRIELSKYFNTSQEYLTSFGDIASYKQ